MANRRWWQQGLRPFAQLVARVLAILLAVQLGWVVLGGAAYRAVAGAGPTPWWWDLGAAPAALLGYVLAVRVVGRRPVRELAPAPGLRELGSGAALGTGLFALAMALLVALGAYRVAAGSGPGSVGPSLALAVDAGFVEELIVRGAIMTCLVAWVGGASRADPGRAMVGGPDDGRRPVRPDTTGSVD